MDVNTVEVNAVDDNKKKKLCTEGRCFNCEKQGHIAQYCPKKQNTVGAHAPVRGNSTGCQGMAACTVDVEKKDPADEIARRIQDLVEEEKESILQKLMVLGF
jgi:hypothetical protein